MSSEKVTDLVTTTLGVPPRLLALQDAFGAKQATFLRKVGVKLPQWLRYVRGERLPEEIVLRRIALAAGVSVQWILTGTNEAAVPPPAPHFVPPLTLPHMNPELRERRAFTALVESLKRLDTAGGPTWGPAWGVVTAASVILQRLCGWNDEDWKPILGDDIPRKDLLDHWKKITRRPELSLTEEGRR